VQLSNAPLQIQLPFGNGDVTKTNPLPVPSQIGVTPGAASFTDGFPPLNGTPVSAGGIPPFKSDMNGLLYMLSDVDLWMSAGAGFKWDSGYSTAIGGYPKGSRVLNTAGTGYWLSVTDNNTTNPDTGGAGWVPTWRAVASVYASAQQTLASGNPKVVWDTVEQDRLGLWDAGNHRFSALWAGFYKLSGSIYLPSAHADNFSASVYKNGTLAKQCSQFPQVSDVPLSYPFDAIILCSAGDYLEAFMSVPTSSVLAGQVGSNQAYVFGQIEFLGI
jgi:hypothetical protein